MRTEKKKTENNRIILFILLCVNFPILLSSQPFSTKGQFWASGLTGNDIPTGQSAFESDLGYIPALSLSRDY